MTICEYYSTVAIIDLLGKITCRRNQPIRKPLWYVLPFSHSWSRDRWQRSSPKQWYKRRSSTTTLTCFASIMTNAIWLSWMDPLFLNILWREREWWKSCFIEWVSVPSWTRRLNLSSTWSFIIMSASTLTRLINCMISSWDWLKTIPLSLSSNSWLPIIQSMQTLSNAGPCMPSVSTRHPCSRYSCHMDSSLVISLPRHWLWRAHIPMFPCERRRS